MKARIGLKAPLVLAVLLGLPIVCGEDRFENSTSTGQQRSYTFLVSQGGRNKALLMRVFDAIKKGEDEKKTSKDQRALQVRRRISSKTFLVNAGGVTDFWFIALEPRDWTDHDKFKANAVLTEGTKTFKFEGEESKTVRVLKEVAGKPVPLFTKDEFVRRLKEGETWDLREFETQKCETCGGDGFTGEEETEEECPDCEEGKIFVDFTVKW